MVGVRYDTTPTPSRRGRRCERCRLRPGNALCRVASVAFVLASASRAREPSERLLAECQQLRRNKANTTRVALGFEPRQGRRRSGCGGGGCLCLSRV